MNNTPTETMDDEDMEGNDGLTDAEAQAEADHQAALATDPEGSDLPTEPITPRRRLILSKSRSKKRPDHERLIDHRWTAYQQQRGVFRNQLRASKDGRRTWSTP